MTISAAVFQPPVPAPILPTSYEYYTSGGINSGLSADQTYFTLNDRNISIYSGALHYFRVPRAYWRDRLRKFRAAGLNTVETYIPWNLHEHQSGRFDFGNGGSEMADFLHLTEFLKTAQEEDLFAIVRPGPFICAEFEFGGFPSWLLREVDHFMFRNSNSKYMSFVRRYFTVLLPILALLQFTKGGPIIAFQVENEYASDSADLEYLRLLRQIMLDNGIVELLATSDNPDKGTKGTIPELFLMTGNFNTDPKKQLDMLKANQPNKPLMTMEFWPGWFDYWGDAHITMTSDTFREVYEGILTYPSSVNMYMFHGGTNWRFLNGGLNFNFDFENSGKTIDNLNEGGDYTEKYFITQELLAKYNPIQTKIPDLPPLIPKIAYPNLAIEEQLLIEDALTTIEPVFSPNLVVMERLDINNNSGQSYGYVVYRKENLQLDAGSVLLIEGRVCDTIMVLVNGVLVSPSLENSADLGTKYGTGAIANSTLILTTENLEGATLDLFVENWGRVNTYPYYQFKGLHQGAAKINDVEITDWTIFPLEFKKSWINRLVGWKSAKLNTTDPSLYRAVLVIEDEPQDTFVHMENWTKGIVIVNGFVIGRYAHMGPIQTLYLPAPLLKQGGNEVIIFEQFKPGKEIIFSTKHIYISH
ncbi:hypothetical protein NQ314_017132 [Rhamnusium bicolor]|uniref:Beta-galactosidase n=1 Tax=Rhamnusium bicolor TaxID=1586634 RepID=A0AAV8WU21_9CUCU|nr:hypothetical protein NQ314_017132 [Rhamnusium bicolor]